MIRLAPVLVALVAVATSACGKKGPPLPPLVKLPAAPADFAAERRGDAVDLRFTVPAANTDNTRPANLTRVDVYALTSRTPAAPDQIVTRGVRVATVPVKRPANPNDTIGEDEPAADLPPLEGPGLDQGAAARLREELDWAALAPAPPGAASQENAAAAGPVAGPGPLLPLQPAVLTRSYVAVGVSSRHRRGPLSKPTRVPLVPPPPTPAPAAVSYDENAISVTWDPVAGRLPVQRPREDEELPSTPIGVRMPAIGYNVYDATPKNGAVKLTDTPVGEPAYSDPRIVWGEERCYTVRTVETVNDLPVESGAPEPTCVTLVDSFAPAAPSNLQSSPLEGAVNLIWDANTEKDLAGYIVLRGPSAEALTPITDGPIQVTTFLDRVPAGTRYTYAVRAVDKAGNASPLSRPVTEAARE